MNQIFDISHKYYSVPHELYKTEEILNEYCVNYSNDLNEFCESLSRLNNNEIRPNYYNLNEATIVGSLIRILKLHKELVFYYKENKMEILTLFARPIYESFVILKYLIRKGDISQRNFRLTSYQARFKNLKFIESLKDKSHPTIKRQLLKINDKLNLDGFNLSDLETENTKEYKKKWKLDEKSFYEIQSEVENTKLYSFLYGVGSDSIHGTWQEIVDFHLTKKNNGFVGYYYYEKCDCRSIVPINTILLDGILDFLTWNNCIDNEIKYEIDLMKSVNRTIYGIWESIFGEKSE